MNKKKLSMVLVLLCIAGYFIYRAGYSVGEFLYYLSN